jgi:ATP-binding cassette subfamily C (CFTR/MRP) protein 1
MTSAELDDGAVEREPTAAAGSGGDGVSAVQVTDGVFTWDDEVKDGQQEVLRGIDLDIRTGALAAVVGMVGSGKSSLLGCILGEMREVSGKVCALAHFTCVSAVSFALHPVDGVVRLENVVQ